MNYRKRVFRFLLVPISQFAIASTIFILQGGFGGGHLPLDFVVAICCLPGIYAIGMIPEGSIIYKSDFVLIVLTSALFNIALWSAIGSIFYYLWDKRRKVT
jgi:hypothetical protein